MPRSFLALFLLWAAAEPAQAKTIALVYSSNVQGETERCGCAVDPLGGLARRAAEVKRIRRETDGVLAVDAGDLFIAPGKKAGRDAEPRAKLIAQAYARLGVAAFTPGEADLALGAARLVRLLAEAKVPAVSANLFDLDGRPLFETDRIVELAGTKVGIFGVTAAEGLRSWGVEARDPVAASRSAVASLRARGAQIVVALVHVGPAPESRKLLAEVPGIDWAVLGHSGLNLEQPEVAGSVRMLEAMSLGRNLGRLDLHVVDGRGPFVDGKARARLQGIVADHRHQLAGYEQKPDASAYEQQRRGELGRALERETAELANLPAQPAGNWFENRIIPLDKALPDDREMKALIDASKRRR